MPADFDEFIKKGRYNEALKQVENIIENQKKDEEYHQAMIAKIKILNTIDNKKALEFALSLENEFEKLTNDLRGEYYITLSNIYYYLPDIENTIYYRKKFMLTITNTTDKGKLADLYFHEGFIAQIQGNYEEAKVAYVKLLDLKDENVIKKHLGVYYNLAIHYLEVEDQVELAIDLFGKMIDLNVKYNNLNIAIFQIIRFIDILNNKEKYEDIDKYLDKLRNLKIDTSEYAPAIVKRYELSVEYCRAVRLKMSNRIKDKAQAQTIFENIISLVERGQYKDSNYLELRNRAMNHLFDMLIEEYLKYEDPKTLEDIKKHAKKVKSIYRRYEYFTQVRATLKRIDAKIALIELDLDKFIELYNEITEMYLSEGQEANAIANEKEQHEILELITEGNKVPSDSDIFEKIRKVNITRYLSLAKELASSLDKI